MEIDELTIKQAKELAAIFGQSSNSNIKDPAGERRILILDRGWVVVGKCYLDGCEIIVRDGAVIRRWGTTAGLGELAEKGPLVNTKLDPTPELRVHQLNIIGSIKCEVGKW